MHWQAIESKMFTAAAYEAQGRMLYLRFPNGDVYRNFEFLEEQYREFLAAESRGRYFLRRIRDRFRFKRLAKLRVA